PGPDQLAAGAAQQPERLQRRGEDPEDAGRARGDLEGSTHRGGNPSPVQGAIALEPGEDQDGAGEGDPLTKRETPADTRHGPGPQPGDGLGEGEPDGQDGPPGEGDGAARSGGKGKQRAAPVRE